MTEAGFRKLALSLTGAVESAHMNHPDFRIGGKIFASLGYPEEGWGMVKLTPEQQVSFIARAPGAFKPCAGVWGQRGATNFCLALAKEKVVMAALKDASQNIVSKTKAKKS